MKMTSPTVSRPPSTPSELQLYVVLQRANLLSYFETFISQGGDDVQQLIEAGEEEFLEIMALVGMASKPLHVRRLQKALQEFSLNPAGLHLQKLPPLISGGPVMSASVPQVDASPSSIASSTSVFLPVNKSLVSGAESPGALSIHSDNWSGHLEQSVDNRDDFALGSPGHTPVLSDAVVERIALCASEIAKTLPFFQPKLIQNKKKISKELLRVVSMPESAPDRLEEFRKYAAIYGRFDAKRKFDKPLTLHEVSVNEAAAQICLHRPALLTRRDELFPLARQAVRDSGYQYARNGMAKNRAHDSEDYEDPLQYQADEEGGSFSQSRAQVSMERSVSEGSQSVDDSNECDEKLSEADDKKHWEEKQGNSKKRGHVPGDEREGLLLVHGDHRRMTTRQLELAMHQTHTDLAFPSGLCKLKRHLDDSPEPKMETTMQQQRDAVNLTLNKRGRSAVYSEAIKSGADSTTVISEGASVDYSVDSTNSERQSLNL